MEMVPQFGSIWESLAQEHTHQKVLLTIKEWTRESLEYGPFNVHLQALSILKA